MDATSTALKMIKKGSSLAVGSSDKTTGIQLRQAAEKGNLEEVKTLLAAGAPLIKDQNGLTPFHRAARKGHTNIVRHLLSSAGKTKPNTADKYGWTPLHWAAWNGHFTTVHALTHSKHCIVNSVDKAGSNPLHCAALHGHLEVTKELVAAKCDTNLQRKDGWSPLHLAVWNNKQEVVHELIVGKAAVNIATNDGQGPLHLAARKGYETIALELLDGGAAIDMQDNDGNTALHHAVINGQTSIVQILMSGDCRINVHNKQGLTPMDIAQSTSLNDIITLLSGIKGLSPTGSPSHCSHTLPTLSTCTACDDMRQLIHRIDANCTLRNSDLKRLQWSSQEGQTLASHLDTLYQSTQSQQKSIEKVWQEKVKEAQKDVLIKCDSRIAEIEREYQLKVDRIEKECSARINAAKLILSSSSSMSRVPSAPMTRKCPPHKLSVISL